MSSAEMWFAGKIVVRIKDGVEGEIVALDDRECGGFPLPVEEVLVEWTSTGDQTWEKISGLNGVPK